jgi:uncharacterized cupredoxin-like copper-binding protein
MTPTSTSPRSLRSTVRPLMPTLLGVASVLLLCAVALVVVLLQGPHGALALPHTYQTVHVTEEEFALHPSTTHLKAGKYLFVDKNLGAIQHELVMWKTDLDVQHMPFGFEGDKNRVNEDSPDLETVLDSASDLNPGETRWITAVLEPGHYVLVCNLPGHFHRGMHVDITVD